MSTQNPTHIIAEHRAQLVHAHAHSLISVGSTMNLECSCGGFATAGPYSVDEMYAFHAAHVVSKLTDAGYSIVQVPESHPPSDLFQDWWTDDGGWTVERHRGSPQIRLTFDEDDAMETSPDGEFYPFSRLTAIEAHDLGVALIAAAAAAEGEKP